MQSDKRILLLDIETGPALVYTFQLFDQNIGLDQIVEPGRVICWAAKWVGKPGVMYMDERGGAKPMFEGIHALLCEADAVVTYNGDHFDLCKLDGAFVEHDIPPSPPPTSIDLYKTIKKLGYLSGKLAFVGPFLHIGEKVKHEGFGLWKACMAGDEAAWKRMRRYNRQDVVLLEGLYERLRPYIRNHPHLGLGGLSKEECPACGSLSTQSRGVRRTRSFLIKRMQCLSCGGWFQGERQKV